ncbi:hypothetical protein AHAS_Ahas02G0184100 [Arachis hypogaea]
MNISRHKERQPFKNEKGEIYYYVKMISDVEDEESKASNPFNSNMKIWEEVLSIGMQHNLKIKRKREGTKAMRLTDSNWEEDQESSNSKRRKNENQQQGRSTTKVEEVGLAMPLPSHDRPKLELSRSGGGRNSFRVKKSVLEAQTDHSISNGN